MFFTRIDNKNYLVKIPCTKEFTYSSFSKDEILSFFKEIFSKLINKYKICGDVIINFYLDYNYGVILEIYNKRFYGEDINTKIIFHLNCKFLVEVDYFDYIGKNKYLYYFKDKFYVEIDEDNMYDGEIIYDNEDIIDNSIRIHA